MKQLLPVVLFALVACQPPTPKAPRNHAQAYGLRDSFVHRGLVKQAIARANRLLGNDELLPLWPLSDWSLPDPSRLPPHRLESYPSGVRLVPAWEEPREDGIPVYVVDGEHLRTDEIIFVPKSERCIFVNADQLPAFFELFRPPGQEETEDQDLLLVFALLHEAGHLYYNDPGSFTEGGQSASRVIAMVIGVDDINNPQVLQENPELRADLFAIQQLKAAMKAPMSSEKHQEGSTMMMLLYRLPLHISAARVVKNWSALGEARAALFRDTSYTHPNLELRMLLLSCMDATQPKSTTCGELLKDFLEERQGPSTPSPWDGLLYQIKP